MAVALVALALLLAALPANRLTAQGTCDAYGYYVEARGFGCGEVDGEICIVQNGDWVDNDCLNDFHFEITYPYDDAVAFDLDPFFFISQDPNGTSIVGLDLEPYSHLTTATCFRLSLHTNPQVELTVEVVSNGNFRDRRFLSTIRPAAITTIGAPNTVTDLSQAIAAGQLPAGGVSVGTRIQVEGTLRVDTDYRFTGDFGGPLAQVVMAPDARLEVLPDIGLDLLAARVVPCEDRWDRIKLHSGARLWTYRSVITGADVAVDLDDKSELLFSASTISDCGTGVVGIDPGAGAPNILLVGSPFEFSQVSKCASGMVFEDADLVDLSGAIEIATIGDSGIRLKDASLNADSRGLPFVIAGCGHSGISASGAELLSARGLNITQTGLGVYSSGTTELRLREGILSDNHISLASAQFNFSSYVPFRPTNLEVRENEFFLDAYNIFGYESASTARITGNQFRADQINVSLYGGAGSAQRWRIAANPAMTAQADNVYINYATQARVFDNPLMDGGRNLSVLGGEQNSAFRNAGLSLGTLSTVVDGSPRSFLDCNRWEGDLALQILGNSAGGQLKGNDLTGSGYNLAFGSPTRPYGLLGTQFLNGNRFDLSSPDNPKVIHYDIGNIPRNRFFVGSQNQPGSALAPFWTPSQTLWLTQVPGTDFVCLALNPPGVTSLEETVEFEREAWDNSTASTNRTDLGIKLLRHLRELEDQQALTSSQVGTRNVLQSLSWAKAIEAERLIAGAQMVWDADSTVRAGLRARLDTLLNARPSVEWTTLDTVLDAPRLDQGAIDLLLDYREALARKTDSLQLLRAAYGLAIEQRLVQAQAVLSDVDAGDDPVGEALVFTQRMAIRAALGQSISASDQQALRVLAQACPSSKGEGVFHARSLVVGMDLNLDVQQAWCDESGAGEGAPVATPEALASAMSLRVVPSVVARGVSAQLWHGAIGTVTDAAARIVDLRGRVVGTATIAAGADRTDFDTRRLPAGSYIVEITRADGQQTTARFVVVQ